MESIPASSASMQAVSSVLVYACGICGKAIKQKYHLTAHFKTHSLQSIIIGNQKKAMLEINALLKNLGPRSIGQAF